MREELNTILPGNEPLANLNVSHLGAAEYMVLSARNGQPTAHTVDLSNPSCTCEDMVFNRDDNEVCAHVCAAAMVHEEYLSVEENLAAVLMNQTATVRDVVEQARDAAQQTEQALVGARDHQAGAAAEPSEPDPEPADPIETTGEDQGTDTLSAISTAQDWVDSQFIKPALVEIGSAKRRVQGRDVECVELDCDYDAEDAAHETWSGIMSSKDSIYWDGDEYVNYVPVPDVPEVFG